MEEKVQRLSEGMDFIEEALGYGEPLTYTEANENVISESDGAQPSPYKILGRCCGNFQPIGEFSRNKRLYSDDLWNVVLENKELQSRLAHRAVFGCLGHSDKLVDDRDIQEGKVSHIVTKLEVRENQETHKPFLYGELEILDTPAGRILEAMYKGGADLYVSSRAAGKLYPAGNGLDYSIVRPDQYHFHCFDIVCRPGFLGAKPVYEEVPTRSVNMTSECAKSAEKIQEAVETQSVKSVQESTPDLIRLESQVSKLTKILEKVVDDVYEVSEQSSDKSEANSSNADVEAKLDREREEYMDARAKGKTPSNNYMQNFEDSKERARKNGQSLSVDSKGKHYHESLNKAAIITTLKLLTESNISEEAFSSIIDTIKKGMKG